MMGDILQVLFSRPDLCSTTGSSSDWAKQTHRVFLGALFPAHQLRTPHNLLFTDRGASSQLVYKADESSARSGWVGAEGAGAD